MVSAYETNGACTINHLGPVVTVNPTPGINSMSAAICSSESFTVTPVNGTNGTVPVGTTYTWGAPAITGSIAGGVGGGGANISGTLTNNGSTAGTAIYTVTPVAGACTGPDFLVTVTVNPTPDINDLTAAICSGGTFAVTPVDATDGVVPAGTIYSWPGPTVTPGLITGGASGTNSANISGTLTNTTNSVQTATYTVTPKTGGCTGASFDIVVTVNPKPAITAMTATICSGETFTVTPVNSTNGIVPAGTTYSWTATDSQRRHHRRIGRQRY